MEEKNYIRTFETRMPRAAYSSLALLMRSAVATASAASQKEKGGEEKGDEKKELR